MQITKFDEQFNLRQLYKNLHASVSFFFYENLSLTFKFFMIFLCFTNTHTTPSSVTRFTHDVHHIENSIKSGTSEG